MSGHRSEGWSRREFLAKATLAGAAGILGFELNSLAAEPPPETTRIRLSQVAGICVAPQYVVRELLPGEGFRDIQYVFTGVFPYAGFASGAIDISMLSSRRSWLSWKPAHRSRFSGACISGATSF